MIRPPASVAARPLAWLALAAIGGIAAAHLGAGFLLWWNWAGAAALGLIVSLRFRQTALLLALAFLAFGFQHAVTLRETTLHPLYALLQVRHSPLSVVVDGSVVKSLRRDLPGAQPGQALFAADTVLAPALGKEWDGRSAFRLVLIDRTQVLAPGRYHLEGRVSLAPAPDNPGQFDERDYDLRHHLVAELKPSKIEVVALDHWNFWDALDRGAETSREWVKETLSAGMKNDDAARTIVLATVLGGAEAGARDLEQPFRVTGTLHIFAVAGLHVGIVGLILRQLLKLLRLPRPAMTAILIVALFGYSFITGLRPSTVRAAVMAAVFLSSGLFNRRSDMLNSMGGAALILLALDTSQLLSVGFQLSFGVITSIALLHHRFMNLMRRWTGTDAFMPQPLLNWTQRFRMRLRFWLAEGVAISAASWIGSLPFTVGHFHLATPVALVANLVLVPVAFLVLFASVLTIVLTLLRVPFLPLLLGNANWAFGRFAIFAAHWFAAIPGGNFFLSDPSFTLRAPVELTVLRLRSDGAAQELRVHDQHWLLDAGAGKDYDFLLRPYLNEAGVNHLEGLVLSNGGFEHAGGVLPLMRDSPPRQFFLSGAEDLSRATRNSTLGKLRASGVNFAPLNQGSVIDLAPAGSILAKMTVLFPPPHFRSSHSDDRSMVARLDVGPFRILWCGDAGFNAEKALLASDKSAVRCDVLLRNQRATGTSLLTEFLDAASPRAVISSNNHFPAVAQKIPDNIRTDCQKRHILFLDQTDTGAVSLRLWPQRLEIHPFRGATITLPR